ncbi:MAG: ABC transporter permease [Oscillospiraceae bacterium]|nr:ABC transporter permease [Oscillospiraceae bacterium]
MEKKSTMKKITQSKSFTLIIVLIVVVIFFYIMNKNYLASDNIRNILNAASLTGTLAVGIACILISGNCDLSAGSVGMLGGVLVAMALKTGMPWPLALLISICFGLVAGGVNAILVNVFNFMPFIATLAMSSVWKGIGLVLTDSQNIAISNQSFWKVGAGAVLGIPMPFIIMVALLIIYGFILNYTRFGRFMYMCGGNRNAARLAGINPKRISAILYLNCSAIACLGGSVLAARMHTGSPSSVIGQELEGITASVLGGVSFTGGSGGMLGCFFGLILLNCFNNGLTVIGLGSYWQIVASGVLLILALVLDFVREKNRIKKLKAEAAKA